MTRYDIINRFISDRNFTSFLEIGTYRGEAFRHVSCERKVSVDPDESTPATYHLTSDAYFLTHKEKFDIVFIDGLHECNQVWRDIQNSLSHLNNHGVIILHDCHPTSEKMQEKHMESQYGAPWTGDVWKAFVKARATLRYELYVVDNDMGCGVIDTALPRTSDVSALPTDMDCMIYYDFVSHPEWMNFRRNIIRATDRAVVYAGTRNLYHEMTVSAKSLLYHNGADRVFFLIEDDTFPEDLPDCITCINVSNQEFFRKDGPNYNNNWTYMVMIRAVLSKLFPQYDCIIHLDHDTIVRKPIDCLWNLNLDRYYFAAVEEKQIRIRPHPYFNFGVVVHNLQRIREDKVDDTIIQTLNTSRLALPEQDAVNSVCKRNILELPATYNAMYFNIPKVPEENVVIKHYAGRSKTFSSQDEYKHYDAMTWEQALKGEKKK